MITILSVDKDSGWAKVQVDKDLIQVYLPDYATEEDLVVYLKSLQKSPELPFTPRVGVDLE